MKQKLKELKQQFEDQLESVSGLSFLEDLEQAFFGRKNGALSLLMKELKDLSGEQKKEAGKVLNTLKTELESLLDQKKQELQQANMEQIAQTESIDVTQPKLGAEKAGHLHPNTLIQYQLEDLFASMGFLVADGPELESDYYNFSALNVPPDHPARDMQDTFYIKGHPDWVMRTQTSSFQVRAMQKFGVPLRLIVPGRVFRNESTDPRHEHTFYQLEGIVVDHDINFSHMKGVLETVAKHLYGEATQMRLRPKFYPFVEPGVNGEVTCSLCTGAGCRVCKYTGWMEIFGAGMVHPHVLKEGGVDSTQYQGFAFGFGLSRLVMLKYGIEDVRHLQSGDLRFLEQF